MGHNYMTVQDTADTHVSVPPAQDPVPVDIGKPSLLGLTRAALADALREVGIADKAVSMRSQQLWHWLYFRGVRDFDSMTNISKDLRAQLDETFSIARPEIATAQISEDGTRKWLIDCGPGIQIETVFIPDGDRGTLCVSSQVGCTLNCSFCHTGTQKLVRNLTAREIVAQIMIARDDLDDWPKGTAQDHNRAITNIVFMGMGEPLYNFDNVKDAIDILSDNEGISLSKRRITVSTSGIVPHMERCGNEIGAMLAVSLHAVRDDIRNELVPINKKYPIADLIKACHNYPTATNAKRITFEYVMLKDINDSLADAKALVQLIKGIPAKVNLIPFNPWDGAPYECSDWEQIEDFADVLLRAGYASPIRTPRGRDIMAACGQLKSASVKERASVLRQRQAP